MEKVKKNDFVELSYTGYVNGKVFDSTEEEELKKIDTKAKAKNVVIIVGQNMIVPGLDKALEGKDHGVKYEIDLKPREGFGERKKEMVKTIPLKIFVEKQIIPYPGMVLNMDSMMAKVIAVSGARVLTDFNNPLAGKNLHYTYTIVKTVKDENEKIKALMESTFQFIPEYEVKEDIIIKGPKVLEIYVKAFSDKFKEFAGKSLKFELKEKKADEKKEEHVHEHNHEHSH